MTQVVPAQAPSAPMTWRPVRVIVWTEFFWVSIFVIGVLLPYYANDLDALSLSELTSGAHDPKDLWPYNATMGGWLRLFGLFSLVLAPVSLLLGGLWAAACAGYAVVSRRGRSHASVPLAVTLTVLAVASIWGATLLFSPTTEALIPWLMD
jgi:hypothetical protein